MSRNKDDILKDLKTNFLKEIAEYAHPNNTWIEGTIGGEDLRKLLCNILICEGFEFCEKCEYYGCQCDS